MNTPTLTLTDIQFKRVLGISRKTFWDLLSHLLTINNLVMI
ncbi:hypothetical protein [Thiolinea disciformis]|nr:hypothetical protein [Thiolinea disciformis]